MQIGEVIKLAGGGSRLAAALGISAAAVSQWRQVPHHRVLAVARIIGVAPHALRPDLYPPPAPTEAA